MRDKIETTCGYLAGAALFAIMALTFFDVLGRKFLDNSIPGALELTEFLMVVVIFAALPLVTFKNEHVVFDSFDHLLSPTMAQVQRWLIGITCLLMMLGLAYLMWRTGDKFAQNGETSAQLSIPKSIFIYGMSVMCAVTALAYGYTLLASDAGNEESAGVL
jgi:TRAP-type transport system small permease protein